MNQPKRLNDKLLFSSSLAGNYGIKEKLRNNGIDTLGKLIEIYLDDCLKIRKLPGIGECSFLRLLKIINKELKLQYIMENFNETS